MAGKAEMITEKEDTKMNDIQSMLIDASNVVKKVGAEVLDTRGSKAHQTFQD